MAEKSFSRAELTKLADELQGIWPEKATQIRQLAERGVEGIKLNIGIKFTLEKFDGEHKPGKAPVEVIEGTG